MHSPKRLIYPHTVYPRHSVSSLCTDNLIIIHNYPQYIHQQLRARHLHSLHDGSSSIINAQAPAFLLLNDSIYQITSHNNIKMTVPRPYVNQINIYNIMQIRIGSNWAKCNFSTAFRLALALAELIFLQ